MKKLMVMAAIAVCAVQAQAATYYGLGYQSTLSYSGGSIKAADLGYYSVYSLNRSDLESIMGTTAASKLQAEKSANAAYNVDVVTSWLEYNLSGAQSLKEDGNEWEVNTKQLISSLGSSATEKKYLGAKLTETTKASAPALSDNRWVITFYDNGDDHYVRVANAWNSSTSSADEAVSGNDLSLATGAFLVRGGCATEWGDWVSVSIPEPTSGLLMLIGMAGLALKRKRA